MSQKSGPNLPASHDAPSLASDRRGAREDALLRLLAGSRSGDLLLLAGGGAIDLGAAVLRYRDEHGHPELAIYAPDAKSTDARLASVDLLAPCMAGDLNQLAEKLANHLVYRPAARIALFPPPELADPGQIPQLRRARAAVDKVLSRSRVNTGTQNIHWHNWLDNLTENFPLAFRQPDLTTLRGVFQNVPALVLGAGPSLDSSLEFLQEASQKCLVLGAASVLAPLRDIGVSPHLAAALEGKDESRQFLGADPAKTLLTAASSSHFNHFRKWPCKSSVFHMQAWASELSGLGQVLPTGGHATSAAFSLAVLWGCNPIILAGQDLAYTGGRVHASSRPGGEDYTLPDLAPVPAIGGGIAQTTPVMESYLHWYQESASYLKGADRGRRLINATAQGAFIPGFIHRELASILRPLPALSKGLNLVDIATGLPTAADSVFKMRLGREISLTKRALDALSSSHDCNAFASAHAQSAAAWVLGSLPINEPVESRRPSINYLLQCLLRMREALHDAS